MLELPSAGLRTCRGPGLWLVLCADRHPLPCIRDHAIARDRSIHNRMVLPAMRVAVPAVAGHSENVAAATGAGEAADHPVIRRGRLGSPALDTFVNSRGTSSLLSKNT